MSGDRVDWVERCEPLRQAQADPTLSSMERRVFTTLWTFAGPDGCGARPGVELLSDCLSTPTHTVHVRTVRNALKRLAELGYAEVTAPPNRRNRIATTYRLRMPDIAADTGFLAREALRGKPDCFSAQSDDVLARKNDSFSAHPLRAQKVVSSKDRSARASATPPHADNSPPQEQPDPYCPDHMPLGTVEGCGACGAAGRILKAWKNRQAEYQRLEAETRRRTVADCTRCAGTGFIDLADNVVDRCECNPRARKVPA